MAVSGPFLVGIDLGTTHTVVASARAGGRKFPGGGGKEEEAREGGRQATGLAAGRAARTNLF